MSKILSFTRFIQLITHGSTASLNLDLFHLFISLILCQAFFSEQSFHFVLNVMIDVTYVV